MPRQADQVGFSNYSKVNKYPNLTLVFNISLQNSSTFEPNSMSVDEVHTYQLPRHRAQYIEEGWRLDLKRPPGDRQHDHVLGSHDHLAILNLFDLCNIWCSDTFWPSYTVQWFIHCCPGLPDCSFLNFCHFSSSLSLPHTYWCVQEFCPQPTCLKILSLVWFQSHLIFQPVCWHPRSMSPVIVFPK